MRPRIFSLMLLAFGGVIVLSIGGMLGVFGLAVVNVQRGQQESWGPPPIVAARAEARRLGDDYRRRGSWQGVEPRFGQLEGPQASSRWESVALLDREGRVVTSSRPWPPLDQPVSSPSGPGWPAGLDDGDLALPDALTVQTVPIQVRGQQVGSLVLVATGLPERGLTGTNLARAVGLGGLVLATLLLGLAALFSGRISTPLRQLNQAAHAMAGGDLAVRVRPGAVREVADLAESFNRMAVALERADQQRRQLTADVAHELRTPLSIIKGRLEGVQDGVYRADPAQIDQLLGEVDLLERLIEDLRLLALADAGQLPLYREPCDPRQVALAAVASFADEAARREVHLQADLPATLPELQADPQRIAQVLGNLLANALHHTPPGGSVTLRVEPQPGEPSLLCFGVHDTGVGIAPVDLPMIFDRFYRADRARTRSSGGAGLGLAITRRIIEAHGGRAWATSTLGQGTTVSFTLPIC
ncbi:MAG: ATP-binding protein [Oscillochloridaceae bacterium umkhey_bin13]